MPVLDQIEQAEARADRQYNEMLQQNGKLLCGCGRIFDPDDEGGTLTADPYAMPACGYCLEQWWLEYGGQT